MSSAPGAYYASQGTITINNKIGGSIYITFTGPRKYAFFVGEGKSEYAMEQGTFNYSYFAGGETNTGSVKVKKNTTLALKLIRAKLTFNNIPDGNVYMTIEGPMNKSFGALLENQQLN